MNPSEREFFQTLSQLFNQERVSEMKPLIDACLADTPESGAAHFWRGRLAEKAHDLKLAVSSYEAAIRGAPTSPVFLAFLAQALERKLGMDALSTPGGPTSSTHLERIEACWKKAVELAPQQQAYRSRYALFLAEQNRLEEAFSLIEEAFRLAPGEEDVKAVWLRVNLKIGCAAASRMPPDSSRALQHLGNVLQQVPLHGDANLFTGICLKKMGKSAEAVPFLERSLPSRPDESRSFLFMPFFELATILIDRGDLGKAREIVQRGLQIDPQSPALAELLSRTGQAQTRQAGPAARSPAPSPPAGRPAPPIPASEAVPRNSLWERVAPDFEALPANLRPLCSDLAKAVDAGEVKKAAPLATKLLNLEAWTILGNPEQRTSMGRMIRSLLQEAFASLPGGGAPLYQPLLTFSVRLHGALGEIEALHPLPVEWFSQLEHLAGAVYDPASGGETRQDELYEFVARALKEWATTPGFLRWAALGQSHELLVAQASRWMRDLANHLQNRREAPFFHLLDLLLALLSVFPSLLSSLHALVFLVPAARKAFIERLLLGNDRIGAVLDAGANRAGPDLQAFLADLAEGWKRGIIPPTPPVHSFAESPELTVEFVYRSALEEILGDGRITPGEEEVLQNLRDFLEIQPQEFQRLFQEVLERKQANQIPVLERDFSPEEFLFKVLQKMMEDGQITEAEREIVKKISNALLLSQDTLAKVFRRVKEKGGAVSQTTTEEVRLERRRVFEVADQVERESRARAIFFSENGQQALGKVKAVLDAFRDTARKSGREREIASLSRFSATNFFYDPQAFPLPVIALFLEGGNPHNLRLRFKGGRIAAHFTEDVRALVADQRIDPDGRSLVLENEALGFPIKLQTIFLEDDLRRFLAGVEECGGKYALMLVHHGFLAPLALIPRKGFIDPTGLTRTGLALFSDGLFEEAANLFADLQRRLPRLHDTWYYLGRCHAALGSRGQNPGRHLPAAADAFRKELELNPTAWKAMWGLGLLEKQAERWSEAIRWLKNALELSPAAIPVLTSLVTTLYDRDTREGIRFPGIPEYIPLYLGKAWSIMPQHPEVVSLTDQFGRIFQIDLPRFFQGLPFDTRYQ